MSQEGEVPMLHRIFNACSSVSVSGAIAKWDFNKSLLIYDYKMLENTGYGSTVTLYRCGI